MSRGSPLLSSPRLGCASAIRRGTTCSKRSGQGLRLGSSVRSCWHSPGVAEAAQERGRAWDLQATAKRLQAELEGWDSRDPKPPRR